MPWRESEQEKERWGKEKELAEMLSLTSTYTRVTAHNTNTHTGLAAAAGLEEQVFWAEEAFWSAHLMHIH